MAVLKFEGMPNRNFTIEAGTQIPCVLQTALDSTLSGLVGCVVPYRPVRDGLCRRK